MAAKDTTPALLDTLAEVVPHERLNRKTYETALVVPEKNEEDKRLIELALHNNSLFTCLDEEQISRFIKVCRLVEFEPGEVIFAQGEKGYDCFVVVEGEAEVYDIDHDGTEELVATRPRGATFGDGSMIFHRRRSATIKAKTPMRAWVVDDRVFVDNVLHSARIKNLFHKYASLTDSTGEKIMTMDDFVRSCNDSSVIDVIKYSQLRSLYRIVRGDQEFVRFKDFSLFNMFMTRPDPEYDIAFLLFDQKQQGFLTLEDVKVFLRNHVTNFNYDCDLIKRFFGANGLKRIRVEEFSLFFNKLQNEMAVQAFLQMDPQATGAVSVPDFFSLLSNFGRRQLSEPLVARISDVRHGRKVHLTDFLAYQQILANLPSLYTTIATAMDIKSGALSKDDFKVACRVLNRRFSRLECDVVFELFDLDNDGFISADDCRTVLGSNYIKDLKAIVGRGGAFTFAPPPGYNTLKDLPPPTYSQPAPVPKTFKEALTHFVEHFLLGAIAGGIGAFAVYPIDLVKTRMQNQRSGKAAQLAAATGNNVVQYKGNWDCFRTVIAKEGAIGLYRGLVPQLVGVAPEKAIKLTVNDLLRDMFTNRDKVTGKDNIYLPLEVLAGCGAGASQVVFTNPLEIVKIRLQMQGETALLLRTQGLPVPPAQTAAQVVKELGLVGIYKGASACFLRDIPFSGIYFPAYAAAKKWVAGDSEKMKPHHLLIAGALAGIPAASLTTPADVIKTRLQVVPRKGEVPYEGIADCALSIYKNEGLGAFFKGALMRVFRSSPQFGVTLLAYEGLRMLTSSELEPRPPTNVPISYRDYDAFRKEDLATKADAMSMLVWGAGGAK